jgi:hypothetical protein
MYRLRRQTMEMLAEGALGRAEAIFDNFRITIPDTSYEYLYATAERAVPKLTHRTRWALPPGSAGPSLAHATDGTAFASQQQSDASAALPPQRMGGEAAELRHPFAWCAFVLPSDWVSLLHYTDITAVLLIIVMAICIAFRSILRLTVL